MPDLVRSHTRHVNSTYNMFAGVRYQHIASRLGELELSAFDKRKLTDHHPDGQEANCD